MPKLFREFLKRVPARFFPAQPRPAPERTEPPPEFPRPPPRAPRPAVRADGRAVGYVDERPGSVTAPVTLIAFYATPDWSAVAGALPQFDGHAQPRLPGPLRFYDHRVLPKQIELAKKYGIGAFCFEPGDLALEALLADRSLDFRFCIAGGRSDDPRHLDVAIPERSHDAPSIAARFSLLDPTFAGAILDGRACASEAISAGYDDEPRRPGAGRVLYHASPRRYEQALASAVRGASGPIFIDAWNDWSRGAVLEPDARLGFAYLEATRRAISGVARVARDPRPVAVVHVYYLELLDEIVSALKASCVELRLIVTTPEDRVEEVRTRLAELEMPAEVEAHENRGRDILPFLRVANRLIDEGVEVVLKLHTKHSGHRADGASWRAQLIGRLVDPSRARTIVEAFARDPELGCVAPEGHVLPLSVYWGWNEETVRHLCVRMGVRDPDVRNDEFAAGSMFWIRLSALRPLLDAHLGEWEFEREGGFVDGTMAHGIERALTLSVVAAGFRAETAASVCGVAFADDAAYPFAQKSDPG